VKSSLRAIVAGVVAPVDYYYHYYYYYYYFYYYYYYYYYNYYYSSSSSSIIYRPHNPHFRSSFRYYTTRQQ